MLVDATAVKRRGRGARDRGDQAASAELRAALSVLHGARLRLGRVPRDARTLAVGGVPPVRRREGDELVSARCDWCSFGVVELAPRIEVVVGER